MEIEKVLLSKNYLDGFDIALLFSLSQRIPIE